jgi:hypothetical protein
MRACIAALLILSIAGVAGGQTRRKPSKPAPKPPAAREEPANVRCPALLGAGVKSGREFCDVLTGREPAEGVLIAIPPHTGPAIVSFDLHNRHTYSEQQVRAGKGFVEYSATIGLLTLDNTLVSRAVVRSSFRTAADLVDRISGGAGPGGVKAVAPVGTEAIQIEVGPNVNEVSLLGERLAVEQLDGRETFTAPGRPIAIVSNVRVEYRPAPPKARPRK